MSRLDSMHRFMPCVTRLLVGKVELSLPIRAGEGRTIRPWLRQVLGPGVHLTFNRATSNWEVGRSHLGAARDAVVQRFGVCDVVTEARLSDRYQCDERCQDATGPDCTCSCGGEFHGERDVTHDWIRVGDSTLISRTSTTQTNSRRYVRSDLRHLLDR